MELLSIFKQALMISFLVFVMMLLVDIIHTATQGLIADFMQGGHWRQYALASFLGSTPGCLGAFMNVTLYIHGMITFGAIVGGMIATSGDEAFVMLAQFPGTALALFGLLFVLGFFFAWVSDKFIQKFGIISRKPCTEAKCEHCLSAGDERAEVAEVLNFKMLSMNLKALSFNRFLLLVLTGSFLAFVMFGKIGPAAWNWERITFLSLSLCALYISAAASEHYFDVHIWDHIIKRHLFRVFIWTFGALFFVHWGLSSWNLESFILNNTVWILLIGAMIGMIPESGPHLVFVMMYAQGLIPFSVLFTTSFIQDGHGMLPMLSYSVKDSVFIKIFNLLFGLAVGVVIYALGF